MTGDSLPAPPPADQQASPYRVLARKYRPATFDSLIGQDVLVRTLTNAFQSGRIAHAYMLAGVRGIGKTTTARIIARALNCTGADGSGGITVQPCGACEPCLAIAQDRHLDVIEIDAASRTGVDAMRELLDGVRYRPASARFKVYIIDEVHMLSTQAFNALLKTLEEPPEHVKFIFATTEIRKVPVTVLSRCQRFDLRRVDQATLVGHLGRIAAAEGVAVAPPALQLIARAADGSVRDALSLLDQAIAHAGTDIGEAAVRDMLGLADRTASFDLFEAVMKGDAPAAVALLRGQYEAGADPAAVLEDVLELTHWLTRIKVTPEIAAAPGVAEAERVRGLALAGGLTVPQLARAWQMLLKGLAETRAAPFPIKAADMLLIRLAYTAMLPTPAEALARPPLAASAGEESAAEEPGSGAPPAFTSGGAVPAPRPPVVAMAPAALPSSPARAAEPDRARPAPPQSAAQPSPALPTPLPTSFAQVIALAESQREMLLHGHLIGSARLVRFEIGHLELALERDAPADLPQRLSRFLSVRTGRPWLVTLSTETGAPSVLAQRRQEAADLRERVAATPLIAAIFEAFPGATIDSIRRLDPTDTASDVRVDEDDEPAADDAAADDAAGPIEGGAD